MLSDSGHTAIGNCSGGNPAAAIFSALPKDAMADAVGKDNWTAPGAAANWSEMLLETVAVQQVTATIKPTKKASSCFMVKAQEGRKVSGGESISVEEFNLAIQTRYKQESSKMIFKEGKMLLCNELQKHYQTLNGNRTLCIERPS